MEIELDVGAVPLNGDSLYEAARLFVEVDAAYDGDYWWEDVRRHGLGAARSLLKKQWFGVSLARFDGRLVGFAGLDAPVNGESELIRVMTHPGHTGKGVATECIGSLLAVANQVGLDVWLDVLEADAGAIRLYRRLGFIPFDNQPGAHSHRPAIQMRHQSTGTGNPTERGITPHVFHVRWSAEDGEYVATADGFPSLSWLDAEPTKALRGVLSLLADFDS